MTSSLSSQANIQKHSRHFTGRLPPRRRSCPSLASATHALNKGFASAANSFGRRLMSGQAPPFWETGSDELPDIRPPAKKHFTVRIAQDFF